MPFGLSAALVLVMCGIAYAQVRTDTELLNIDQQPAAAGNLLLRPANRTIRSLSSKLSDQLSILDFGARCDAVTDDAAPIAAAGATGWHIIIPAGLQCYNSQLVNGSSPLPGVFVGPGQIKAADGSLTGPLATSLSSPIPAGSRININNPSQSFSGVTSALGIAHSHITTGTNTLYGATGYDLNPDASGDLLVMDNTAGLNTDLGDNKYRSGLSGHYTRLNQYGQGDLGAYTCDGFEASVKVGATNYLANPALGCFGGQLASYAVGDYMIGFGDIDFSDNGLDAAVGGSVLNFTRAAAAETIGDNWVADIRQSIGSQPIDAAYRMSGQTVFGLDFANAGLTQYRLADFTVTSACMNCVTGDSVTVTGGTNTAPTVLTWNGTAWLPINTGLYSVPPVPGYSALTLAGIHTAGLAMTGAYTNGALLIAPTTGGCITMASRSGNGVIQVTAGSTRQICVTPAGESIGNPNGLQILVSDTGGVVVSNAGVRLMSLNPTTGNAVFKGTITPSGTP